MPKLWNETIATHRTAVRGAILDTTAALVTEHGLTSVTMSQIAETVGIGRATLYKYFPDVEAILAAWHEGHVSAHLAHLTQVRNEAADIDRLGAVLHAYAVMTFHRPHGTEIAALVHRGEHLGQAHQHLHDLIRDLITEATANGDLRDDVPPDELASYCLYALAAAGAAPTEASAHRLVDVTLDGLRAISGPP